MMVSGTKAIIVDVLNKALGIFQEKMNNYGPAWIGFSHLGFADQIFIKAYRYKTLIHTKDRKIPDPPELELYAVINYCVLFLIARNKETLSEIFNSPTVMFEPTSAEVQKKLLAKYESEIHATVELHEQKDHDYDSAWKNLTKEGIADLIFSKVVRMKAMLSAGRTPCDDHDPDGIGATLRDLINYSAFALVLK
jgi:hypothetical protein